MVLDDVYIVSACRTGIGALNGQFKHIPASVLGGTVIKNCLHRARISPDDISEVIMGQVLTAGQGQNPARQAAINADISFTTPACTINMLGGSSLKAIHLGYQAIRSKDDAKFIVCGGQENMSMAQHSAHIRNTAKFHGIEVQDTMLVDGLTDAFTGLQIGQLAEYFADFNRVVREIQDRFALHSHNRAAKSVLNHDFVYEVVAVHLDEDNAALVKDELIETDVTLTQLCELPLIFEDQSINSGTVTEGNSSACGDGAAAVVLCNEVNMEQMDLIPLARIVGFVEIGVDPEELGIAAVKAIGKVMAASGWNKSEVDLFEIDETFASQTIFVIKKLGLNVNKVNVAGGSIALGQPLGANGARILVTLLHNLHRYGLCKGVAASSIDGGMAIAVSVQRS